MNFIYKVKEVTHLTHNDQALWLDFCKQKSSSFAIRSLQNQFLVQ